MDFPGFDALAVGFILFVALREAGSRLRRALAARAAGRDPLEA
ncbi:hypothetical protein PUH89_11805 [Rhodobacter capsulatus]|uniref:Uncharacterized protein n=1 Tax=Rhodobacter capsulatus TaxID=1061 RepID=A0A1G7S6K1_RHOCA|nr:hypothetical protein [Rhodobacter capsulatus]WER08019.1 hypothetical protein PUH89_11805 [Rhodobacter capsulatus]SDG18628.1 hypothetical protein SAMN04244550_03560 [Rhodobacter capsulatus]